MRSARLLVVVEENKASKRAVSYVAQIVGRRRGFEVCLVHTLPEIPASLIEYGGGQSPEEEVKLDGDLYAEQKQWVLAVQEKAQPTLTRASAVLRKGGFGCRRLWPLHCQCHPGGSLTYACSDRSTNSRFF